MEKYEIYEDNGGGLYLCIMGENGQCERIFENFEYCNEPGILSDAIKRLESDPTAYEAWDGDLVERLVDIEEQDVTAQSLYDDGIGDLIADSTGYWSEHMGFSGRKALNISDDD